MTPLVIILFACLGVFVVYLLFKSAGESPPPALQEFMAQQKKQTQTLQELHKLQKENQQVDLQKLWQELGQGMEPSIAKEPAPTPDDICPECEKAFVCTDDYLCGECRANVG